MFYRKRTFFKVICWLISLCVFANGNLFAQHLLLPSESHSLPVLRGIKINPQDPLKLEFIIDPKDGKKVTREEADRLVNYFLACLAIPEADLWVNLSPYEKNRIIPEQLSYTDLGKDMLTQDYILKQLAASLTYPESETGRKYWDEMNNPVITREAIADRGNLKLVATPRNDAVNALNKIWIVPDKADIYVKDNAAFITDSRLKVMMESDYFVDRVGAALRGRPGQAQGPAPTDAFKKYILPQITQQVNHGEHFAQLRQIYDAFILAAWFKRKMQDSIFKYYIGQKKLNGIDIHDKDAKQKIYNLYLEAFTKGAYNYVNRERVETQNFASLQKITRRHYFSGGVRLDSSVVHESNDPSRLPVLSDAVRVEDQLSVRLTDAQEPIALDMRPVKAFLLHEAFVRYDMAVKRQVNPDNKAKVGVYGGAGVDAPGFLLSLNTTENYFIGDYHGVTVDLLNRLKDFRRQTDLDYFPFKHGRGYAITDRVSGTNAVAALAWELEAIGVDLSKVRARDNNGCPMIEFEWAYQGQPPRIYTITFIDGNLLTDPAACCKKLPSKIDIYYQNAGHHLAGSYPNPAPYIQLIYNRLKAGGFLATDDYSVTRSTRIRIRDNSPEFPIDLPLVTTAQIAALEADVLKVTAPVRTINSPGIDNPENCYGWRKRIRQKPVPPDIAERINVSEQKFVYLPGNFHATVSNPNPHSYVKTSAGAISMGGSILLQQLFPEQKDKPAVVIAPQGSWIGTDGANLMQIYYLIVMSFMTHQQKTTIVCTEEQKGKIIKLLQLGNPYDLPDEAGYSAQLLDSIRREAILLADRGSDNKMINTFSDMVDFKIFYENKVEVNGITIEDKEDGRFLVDDHSIRTELDGRQMRGLGLTFEEVERIKVPPELGVTFLGVSSGLDPKGLFNNEIIWAGDQHILADASSTTMQELKALGLTPKDITHLLVTHLHEDHVSGIAEYFSWCEKNGHPIKLMIEPGMWKLLKEYLALLPGFDMKIIDKVEMLPLKFNEEGKPYNTVTLGQGESEVEIEIARAFHGTPATMFRVYHKGETIACSGDHTFDPPRLERLLKGVTAPQILADLKTQGLNVAAGAPLVAAARIREMAEFLFRPNRAGKLPALIIHEAGSDAPSGENKGNHTSPYDLEKSIPSELLARTFVNHRPRLLPAGFPFKQAVPMSTETILPPESPAAPEKRIAMPTTDDLELLAKQAKAHVFHNLHASTAQMEAIVSVAGIWAGIHALNGNCTIWMRSLDKSAKKRKGIDSRQALCDFIGVPRDTEALIFIEESSHTAYQDDMRQSYQRILMEEVFHALTNNPESLQFADRKYKELEEIINDVMQIVFYAQDQVDSFRSGYKQWTRVEKLALIQRYAINLGINPNASMRTLIEQLGNDIKNGVMIEVGSKMLSVADILTNDGDRKGLEECLDSILKTEKFSRYEQLFPPAVKRGVVVKTPGGVKLSAESLDMKVTGQMKLDVSPQLLEQFKSSKGLKHNILLMQRGVDIKKFLEIAP